MNGNEHYIDASAVGVAVATFFGWLPNIAALLSVIWILIRIWETDTVKGLTGRYVPTEVEKIFTQNLKNAKEKKDEE